MRHFAQFYVALGVETGAVCMLGKHLTILAMSPDLQPIPGLNEKHTKASKRQARNKSYFGQYMLSFCHWLPSSNILKKQLSILGFRVCSVCLQDDTDMVVYYFDLSASWCIHNNDSEDQLVSTEHRTDSLTRADAGTFARL